jgi:hypothetical protein
MIQQIVAKPSNTRGDFSVDRGRPTKKLSTIKASRAARDPAGDARP